MRRARLKQKMSSDLLRSFEHISLSTRDAKSKHDFIREARQITQKYLQYRQDPGFKHFAKYLVENLVSGCEASTVNEIANDLRRLFSKKVNGSTKDTQCLF